MGDSGWHCPAMPWAEVNPMHQRILFVEAARRGRLSMTELCALFGVSRQTGYKWLGRANEGGTTALADLSRRPRSNSAAIANEVAERLVAVRKAHPTWGARKLIAWLAVREPELELPASSTVTELLKRRGLVKPRRVRQRLPPRSEPLAHATAPNVVWSVDFKGDFRVGDGTRCYPLTVTDACSRALLCCQALDTPGLKGVQSTVERTFRHWGLPRYLRSDNGPPFGTMRTGPLSRLSVWLVKVGVLPEYIDPGKPQQNGRHERFHRTLKQETALPPRASLRAQQRRFDTFRREYNHERPHEALSMLTPALMHRQSYRRYPSRVVSPEYPGHYEVRWVSTTGSIKWRGSQTFVAETLAGEPVGLVETELGCWEIYYGPLLIGRLHDALPGQLVRPKVSAMSPV
jgi:putative transposase